MELHRRSFLTGVLTAIAAGTLATTSALAIAPTPDLKPLAETIRQYQELVKFHTSAPLRTEYYDSRTADGRASYQTNSCEELDRKFNTLLTYMMDQFEHDECRKEDVRECFNVNYRRSSNVVNSPVVLLTVADLERVVRGVIPVFVAKQILGFHRINIRAPKVESWQRFVRLYADKLPIT